MRRSSQAQGRPANIGSRRPLIQQIIPRDHSPAPTVIKRGEKYVPFDPVRGPLPAGRANQSQPRPFRSMRSILAIFRKELALELRTRIALHTILAFTGSSLLLILLTLRADQLEADARSGLVWIIILFAAMAGMARSFVAETEQKTWHLLRLHGRAGDIFLGKLLYNTLFLLGILTATFLLYLLMMNQSVAYPGYLSLALLLGATGLASVTTLTSAMIARADRRGAIFSVLSIPLLVPLLLILTRVTRIALTGESDPEWLNDLSALVGYGGATITAGILLFDFIWDE